MNDTPDIIDAVVVDEDELPEVVQALRRSQSRLQVLTVVCLGVVSAVMIAALVIGSAAFVSLRHQSHKTEVAQRQKIARLEAQVEVDAVAEQKLVAEIIKLAKQVKFLGGDPGTFTIEKPVVRDDGTLVTTTTTRPPAGPAGPTTPTAATTSTTITTTAHTTPASTTTTTGCLEPLGSARVCITIQ